MSEKAEAPTPSKSVELLYAGAVVVCSAALVSRVLVSGVGADVGGNLFIHALAN